MKETEKDRTYWLGWYFAYATLGVTFVIAVWYGQFDRLCSAPDPRWAWLPWMQPDEHCLREWISALSGWAALVGALWTIGVMRAQLSEQRRQNDHISGEILPEIFIDGYVRTGERGYGEEYFCELQITVINCNRRSLKLGRLEVEGPLGIKIGIRSTVTNDREDDKALSESVKHEYVHVTLPGKEEGQPAPICIINCHLFKDDRLIEFNPGDLERNENQAVAVKLHGIQKDAFDRDITLTAAGTAEF